jgi:formylglycine-generating enzyme required for sulfatase activity
MVGNVWAWTEDCGNQSYNGAPADGSAWTSVNCRIRVLRGGAWYMKPWSVRSAVRFPTYADDRKYVGVTDVVGFRIGRTLLTP